jgi:hypothetical protein
MEEVLEFLTFVVIVIGAVMVTMFAANETMTALGCSVVAQVGINAISERRS